MEKLVEEWRPVKRFEGLYEVSNTQKIRSVTRIIKCGYGSFREVKGKILSPGIYNGYYAYYLRDGSKSYKVYLHRAIAEAFIPNPMNLPQIDHINTIRTDCRIENLRWCTPKQNQNNSITKIKMRQNLYDNQSSKEKRKATRNIRGWNKKIYRYGSDGKFEKEYTCTEEVSKEIGVPSAHVNNACLYGYALRGKLYRYEKLEKITGHVFSKRKVSQYDKNGNFIKEWDCVKEAQRFYKVKTIYRVCAGGRKTAAGYIWKYSDE